MVSYGSNTTFQKGMKTFRINKIKNWRKQELRELKQLVNSLSNEELCNRFSVSLVTLTNAMTKYNIKRDEEVTTQLRKDGKTGVRNPNWKGGISKNGTRYSAIQRERYPKRKYARDAVYRALKKGIISKPESCEDCGKETENLQAHHESYEEDAWLDVTWLCLKCHRKWDKRLAEKEKD